MERRKVTYPLKKGSYYSYKYIEKGCGKYSKLQTNCTYFKLEK